LIDFFYPTRTGEAGHTDPVLCMKLQFLFTPLSVRGWWCLMHDGALPGSSLLTFDTDFSALKRAPSVAAKSLVTKEETRMI
jgi:hypothetical protein